MHHAEKLSEAENFEVAAARDGQEACRIFDRERFSLVLLDLMIPVVSGMDVLQHIRRDSVVPAIIISARDSETDKTLGSGLGADDYITKPFSLAEVLARVRANLRRTMQSSFIISSYENKTMSLMFSYLIRRRKILGSKMLAVWSFNFTALVICKLILYGAVVLTKGYTHISAESINLVDVMFRVQILLDSAVMVSISFLSLPIGLAARSSRTAIVASVIIVCFTQGQIGEYTLVNNISFYTIRLVMSAAAVFLTLHGVETRDVM